MAVNRGQAPLSGKHLDDGPGYRNRRIDRRVIAVSSVLTLQQPLARLDDDAWEDLLNFIEERRVIPIIGPELLKIETETGPRLLYDWIAEKLAGSSRRLNGSRARRLPEGRK